MTQRSGKNWEGAYSSQPAGLNLKKPNDTSSMPQKKSVVARESGGDQGAEDEGAADGQGEGEFF